MTKTKIRFSSKINRAFVAELRQNAKSYFDDNQLSKYGNFNLVIKSIFMGLLYLLPFILMLSGVVSNLGLVLVAWAIMGMGMAGIGMVLMHDANHGAFSKRSWLNNLLSKSMYFIGGYPANWRHQHNTLHHGFTNIDGHDEDIDPVGIVRISPHKPLKKIHRFQHLYAWLLYGLMTISWASYRDFKQLFFYTKDASFKKGSRSTFFLFLDLTFAKIIYFGVFLALPILLIPVAWYWVVLGFVLMHFVCGFILAIIFQTAHVMPTVAYPLPNEEGEMETNWAIHQLMTTTNYAPKSRIFSWFIGGLNYQVEHHLFPQISHVHYDKLAKIVKATAEKYQIPYYVETTFFTALKKHYQMLRTLGRA
jgi:linoleoyl-CoA desaturase